MNEPGLTHLSISVDDVRATAERAVACGGSVRRGERCRSRIVRARTPTGQLIELLPVSYRAKPAAEAMSVSPGDRQRRACGPGPAGNRGGYAGPPTDWSRCGAGDSNGGVLPHDGDGRHLGAPATRRSVLHRRPVLTAPSTERYDRRHRLRAPKQVYFTVAEAQPRRHGPGGRGRPAGLRRGPWPSCRHASGPSTCGPWRTGCASGPRTSGSSGPASRECCTRSPGTARRDRGHASTTTPVWPTPSPSRSAAQPDMRAISACWCANPSAWSAPSSRGTARWV